MIANQVRSIQTFVLHDHLRTTVLAGTICSSTAECPCVPKRLPTSTIKCPIQPDRHICCNLLLSAFTRPVQPLLVRHQTWSFRTSMATPSPARQLHSWRQSQTWMLRGGGLSPWIPHADNSKEDLPMGGRNQTETHEKRK